MERMIRITSERRQRQQQYNREHKITPRSVARSVQASLRIYEKADDVVASVIRETGGDYDVAETIRVLEGEMHGAADALEFERAAMLRDQIFALEKEHGIVSDMPQKRPGSGARGAASQ